MTKEEAIIRKSELEEILYSQRSTPWTVKEIMLQRIALLDRVIEGTMPVFDEYLLEGYEWEPHTTSKVYKLSIKENGTKYRITTYTDYPGQVAVRKSNPREYSWNGKVIYSTWEGRESIDWDEYNLFMELLTSKKLA